MEDFSMQTLTEKLAEFIVKSTYSDFPKTAVDIVKLSILDSIGCALAGSKTAIGAAMIDMTQYLGGRPESPLLGTNLKTSCTNAAFANAEMANALDFDDCYPHSAHVGATVVQTALAIGCAEHVTGKEFITAVILGYETSTRIGPVVQHPKFAPSKTAGHSFMVFGAAAVAAKLLELNATQTTWALGTAGSAAPIPSDEKNCLNPLNVKVGAPLVKNNYGPSAEIAIRAALLAKRGYKGPIDILEGDTGFPVMIGAQNYDPDYLKAAFTDLGERPKILDLQFKPYPSCRHTHSPIEAALHLQEIYNLNPQDIDEITVKMFTSRARHPLDDVEPKNMTSAQMSIPYAVALALLGVEPGLEWNLDEMRQRSDVLDLAKKVRLQPDPEADAHRQQGYITYAMVQISTANNTYEHRVLHPKGSTENPLTREELTQKFIKLATSTITPESANGVLNSIEALELLENIDELAEKLLDES